MPSSPTAFGCEAQLKALPLGVYAQRGFHFADEEALAFGA